MKPCLATERQSLIPNVSKLNPGFLCRYFELSASCVLLPLQGGSSSSQKANTHLTWSRQKGNKAHSVSPAPSALSSRRLLPRLQAIKPTWHAWRWGGALSELCYVQNMSGKYSQKKIHVAPYTALKVTHKSICLASDIAYNFNILQKLHISVKHFLAKTYQGGIRYKIMKCFLS